ncbi:hypothetical protein PD280_22005 [Virgibacillus salarius]|uniref:hypothetical protein n=2 Tax=Virgibacillus TaxID=84406 RepID=UPI0024913E6E|nr:hypothetical protein [Virgibacillus salarius]WBX80221.1 hypothetical protein PD280_22005 [Virgibacillus salarius]
MKRLIFPLLIMIVLLSACLSDERRIMIKRGELTEYEQKLNQLIGDQLLIYDIQHATDQVEAAIATIDYYEYGQYKDTVSNISISFSAEDLEESIRLVVLNQQMEDKEKWITAFLTKTAVVSNENERDLVGKEEVGQSTGVGGIVEPTPIQLNDKQVIGSIVRTSKGEMATMNHIESEADLKRATNYEQVFIISLELQ